MKKYIKLIVLSLFIIGVIGTFYVTKVLSVKKLPQFEIETVSGDEKVKDNLIVRGSFSKNIYSNDYFRVEDGDTVYSRNKFFLSRDKLFYTEMKVADLQERFPNFMRGKYYYKNEIYEDEQYVVYGTIAYDHLSTVDYEFEIDVLDKNKKKSISSFTHYIPNRNDYWSFELAHVQLVEDEIKLMTINDFVADDKLQEVRLYTFDLNSQKLIGDEQIVELKQSRNVDGYSFITAIHKKDPHSSQVPLYVEQVKVVTVDEDLDQYKEEKIEEKVVLFDLIEQTTEEFDIQKDFGDIGIPFYFDEQSLYFGTTLKNQLNIKKYNLNDKKIEKQLKADVNTTFIEPDNIYHANIKDGILYYIPAYGEEYAEYPPIIVVELESMTMLYEGMLRLKDGVITKDMDLFLEPLEVR